MSAGEPLQQGGPNGYNEPLSGSDQFAHKLHDQSLTKFHTEINFPAPMTGLDVLATYYKKKGLGGKLNVLNTYRDWFRDNMVAYKRKREAGVIQVAAANAQAQAEKKSMQELMLGKAMR